MPGIQVVAGAEKMASLPHTTLVPVLTSVERGRYRLRRGKEKIRPISPRSHE